MSKFYKNIAKSAAALSLLCVPAGLSAASSAPAKSPAANAQCGDPAVEAPKVADRYFDSFNAGDFVANASALHFPSYMLTPQGDFYTFPDLKSYVEMLQGFKATWHHEHVDEKKVVQTGSVKAHIAITASRYDDKNIRLAVHKSMWILTCKDGVWGIKARSHLD